MSRAYSDDLRFRIVRAVEDEGMSPRHAAARFAVGLASVKRYLRQWRTSGDLTPRPHSGRPRAIPPAAQDRLVALLAADPDAPLAAYCERWEAATGVTVSRSTMCRAQQRVGWTVKKSRS
jgi:transposase